MRGAVRYEAIGKPIIVAYCHCSDCRQQSGAPVNLGSLRKPAGAVFKPRMKNLRVIARNRLGFL